MRKYLEDMRHNLGGLFGPGIALQAGSCSPRASTGTSSPAPPTSTSPWRGQRGRSPNLSGVIKLYPVPKLIRDADYKQILQDNSAQKKHRCKRINCIAGDTSCLNSYTVSIVTRLKCYTVSGCTYYSSIKYSTFFTQVHSV